MDDMKFFRWNGKSKAAEEKTDAERIHAETIEKIVKRDAVILKERNFKQIEKSEMQETLIALKKARNYGIIKELEIGMKETGRTEWYDTYTIIVSDTKEQFQFQINAEIFNKVVPFKEIKIEYLSWFAKVTKSYN